MDPIAYLVKKHPTQEEKVKYVHASSYGLGGDFYTPRKVINYSEIGYQQEDIKDYFSSKLYEDSEEFEIIFRSRRNFQDKTKRKCVFFKIDDVNYCLLKYDQCFVFVEVCFKYEELSMSDTKLLIKEDLGFYENCLCYTRKELILEDRVFRLEKDNKDLLKRMEIIESKISRLSEVVKF